jgi:hypothetical protein
MSEIMTVVGFLALLAMLLPRLREQRSQSDHDPHSESRIAAQLPKPELLLIASNPKQARHQGSLAVAHNESQ